ncbi:peptidase inhibitor 16 [Callorhinchus milii]|uniref:Peptidase inhibitor 16-like n=1 Tax=Callorhinchus milii TaxID=7868 RepID=A0A4W3GGF1_CALMI|nr:peptidase inhibitor 16 [Callorhinchus milii]|eukprot:gi/632953457/ref/XP_007892428.1/ PREDICTED: peptidase inhibitor 16-like [Callorhinchus milii]
MEGRSLIPTALVLLVYLLTFLSFTYCLSEEQKQVVKVHNNYRSQEGATNMLKMSWDSGLENIAKTYAAKCIWEHNPERGNVGENLFVGTGKFNVGNAIKSWYDEKPYYTFETMGCAADKKCGHYTQVVWANSNKVGCAHYFCKTVEGLDLKDATILVCNYSPPGNYKNQKPYRKGKSCSECPKGYSCQGNLCSNNMQGGSNGVNLVMFSSTTLVVLMLVALYSL